jgi:voltage-gated potassium channel
MSLSRQVRADRRRDPLRAAVAPFVPRFFFVGVYFAVLVVITTSGLVTIEGWSVLDAFYMAMFTVTEIGYGEVHPLSPTGRMFLVPIMVASVIGLGLLWALITAMVVEIDVGGLMRRRRVMRETEALRDHFIVCGGGRMGRVVMQELLQAGRPLIVVDHDSARLDALVEEHPRLLTLSGDATRDQVLAAAGVGRARGLAACLSDDAANLLLCMTARGQRPDLEIVARANDEETVEKLRRGGAGHVISPAVTGASRMAATLLRPSVVSFLDAVTLGSDIRLRLEETELSPGSPLVGRTLAEAKIPQRTGLIVLALKSGDGRPRYNPGPETRLAERDVMIVLGEPDQVQRLRAYVQEGA